MTYIYTKTITLSLWRKH